MKKILLFLFLHISLTIFAQNDRKEMPYHSFDPLENLKSSTTQECLYSGSENKNYSLKNFELQVTKHDSLIQVYDSIYNWKWDTISNNWIFNSRNINYLYDANSHLNSYLTQKWEENKWVNDSRYNATIDPNGNLSCGIIEVWIDGEWEIYFQHDYTYDENNNKLSYISKYYCGINCWNYCCYETFSYDNNNNLTSKITRFWGLMINDWEPASNEIYIYNSNRKYTKRIYQEWNGKDWINVFQYDYTYDIKNNLTNSLLSDWKENNWVINFQKNYKYDDHNSLTDCYTQNWNGVDWVNSIHEFYSYDVNNDRILENYQEWIENEWVNKHQYSYLFDYNHNETSISTIEWVKNEWVKTFQRNDIYTYDANNFQISQSTQVWQANDSLFINTDSTYFYGRPALVGTCEFEKPGLAIRLFPNPNSGIFYITSNQPINSIEVFDSKGARVYHRNKCDQKKYFGVDVTSLVTGICMVRVSSGDIIRTKKIIIR
jgi:hypothetical protein